MITISVKPKASYFKCPKCKMNGNHIRYIFQGIHNSEEFKCGKCKTTYIWDLPIGHSHDFDFKLNLKTNEAWSNHPAAISWFTIPYQKALKNPCADIIKVSYITNKKVKNPLIINCIDYLYGHGLLKLFNIQRHLKLHKKYDIVLIIPKSLLWLVPKEVAEIILVDIKLSQARNYYPSLDSEINKYISKFKTVALSKAYAHPEIEDISVFTKQKSCEKTKVERITFIWRNDRPWFNNIYIVYGFKKLKIISILNYLQYLKVILLFSILSRKNKKYVYTIAGFGKIFTFPKWIEDTRTNTFSDKTERYLCKIYAQSKLVIGVHGSNMLLPSAHAQMTLDLMPDDRLGNFAQDIVYETKRSSDLRYRAFITRYAYLNTSVSTIVKTILSMLRHSHEAEQMFTVTESK